jgi:hypothetical protein
MARIEIRADGGKGRFNLDLFDGDPEASALVSGRLKGKKASGDLVYTNSFGNCSTGVVTWSAKRR